MRYLLSAILLMSLVDVSAQRDSLHVLDSLLLDAQYDAVVRQVDLLPPSPDPIRQLQYQLRKVQALIRSGKLDDARMLLTTLKPTDAKSTNTYAKALLSSAEGTLLMNEGRYDLAEEALDHAISEFTSEQQENSLEAAEAIANLGLVYNFTGKTLQAEAQLQMALSLRQHLLPARHELIAATLNDLGLVYTSIDPDKALDYYEQALHVYEQLHGQEHPKIAIANSNLGFVYREMELYGDAVNYLETALKIWDHIYPQPHPAKAFVLSNLGQTYVKMRNNEAAIGYFNRAIKMYEDSYGARHPDLASTWNALGNVHLADRKYDEALDDFQKAIRANVIGFDTDDVTADPPLDGFYNGSVFLYSLLHKAEAFEARYFGQSLKFNDLRLSLRALQKSDTLIDKLRQKINNENDKISLGVTANEAYADGVRVSQIMALNALHKNSYRRMAFYFAEKSKSAVLQDAISESNAKSFAGIPSDMLEQEKALKAQSALYTQQLAQKPAAEEERLLREKLYQVNRDYESFIQHLEAAYPEYFNLKFNSAAPSIHELQSKLSSHQAILTYFIDDANARLYTFIITPSRFKVKDQPLPANFDKMITGLRNSLYFNDLTTFKTTSVTLGHLLIPSLPSGVKSLVVIPTGRLSIIPFEVLLRKDDHTEDFGQFDYLVRSYAVSYQFSAGLMLQKTNGSPSSSNILLCAPIEFNAHDNLDALPGTAQEVNAIADLFTARQLKSITLLNDQAEEFKIKAPDIKSFRYLHFATHGVVDELHPELSRIFLNKGEGEDGDLFSGEIYNLQLNADLVTLSACQTGLGRISKGEGVIGLSRALVYAGARYIIVSFWSVADASTAQLMTDFYADFLQQNTPDFARALQQSKLKMIEGSTHAAPYYWAPFVVIGF